MKKLRLEEIRVESFETDAAMDERGTVDAHAELFNTGPIKCGTNFGPNCPTQKLTGICGNCG
jgi:hypothetical protein